MEYTVGDIKLSDLGKKIKFYFQEDYGIVGNLIGIEVESEAISYLTGEHFVIFPITCTLTLLVDRVDTRAHRVPLGTPIEFLDTPPKV